MTQQKFLTSQKINQKNWLIFYSDTYEYEKLGNFFANFLICYNFFGIIFNINLRKVNLRNFNVFSCHSSKCYLTFRIIFTINEGKSFYNGLICTKI